MRKWHRAERGKDPGECLLVLCFSAFFKHVYRWPLDMLYAGFLQFGIHFSSFCSICHVPKCFHRNKANNSKQSRGCTQELVSERHNARSNLKNKGFVALCLLAYFVLLCFVTQQNRCYSKKGIALHRKKTCIYLKISVILKSLIFLHKRCSQVGLQIRF